MNNDTMVAWRCTECDASNICYPDNEPLPYFCERCKHRVTLEELLALADELAA